MASRKDKIAGQGHNSGTEAAKELVAYFERIENLREEKSGLAADERDVFAEAKAKGFDPKAMRQVLKERAMDRAELDEFNATTDSYRAAAGLIDML